MKQDIKKHFLDLLETDSSRMVADIIADEVGDNQEYFNILYAFCFTHSYPVSMRAARVLPFCCEKHPGLIAPYLDEIVDKLMQAEIDGVKRGLMKIMAENVNPCEINNSGLLFDKCVSWAISQIEKPAIRYYSIEILLRFVKNEPLLKNEVVSILELLLTDQTQAIKTRARKALQSI